MEIDLDETYCSELERKSHTYNLRQTVRAPDRFGSNSSKNLPVKANRTVKPYRSKLEKKKVQNLTQIVAHVTQALEHFTLDEPGKLQDDCNPLSHQNSNLVVCGTNPESSTPNFEKEARMSTITPSVIAGNNISETPPTCVSNATQESQQFGGTSVRNRTSRTKKLKKHQYRNRKTIYKSKNRSPISNSYAAQPVVEDITPSCSDVEPPTVDIKVNVKDPDGNKNVDIIKRQLQEAVNLIETFKNSLFERLQHKKRDILEQRLLKSCASNHTPVKFPIFDSGGAKLSGLEVTEEEKQKNLNFIFKTAAHHRRLYENKELPLLNNQRLEP